MLLPFCDDLQHFVLRMNGFQVWIGHHPSRLLEQLLDPRHSTRRGCSSYSIAAIAHL